MLYFLLLITIGCTLGKDVSQKHFISRKKLKNYILVFDPTIPKKGNRVVLNIHEKDEKGESKLLKEVEFIIKAPGSKEEIRLDSNSFIPNIEGDYEIKARCILEDIYHSAKIKIFPNDEHKGTKFEDKVNNLNKTHTDIEAGASLESIVPDFATIPQASKINVIDEKLEDVETFNNEDKEVAINISDLVVEKDKNNEFHKEKVEVKKVEENNIENIEVKSEEDVVKNDEDNNKGHNIENKEDYSSLNSELSDISLDRLIQNKEENLLNFSKEINEKNIVSHESSLAGPEIEEQDTKIAGALELRLNEVEVKDSIVEKKTIEEFDNLDSLDAFINDKEEKSKFISSALEGKNLLIKISNNDSIEIFIESVQHIMNYLFVKACQKNQGFHEGTYILEDSEEKIFNHFVKLGYSRISSHAATRSDTAKHYGIDLEENSILPIGKKHVLFFQVQLWNGEKALFLKPENFGVKKLDDVLYHTIEYAESFFKRYIGLSHNNHDEIHRKERPQYNGDYERKLIDLFNTYVNSHRKLEILGISFLDINAEDEMKQNIKEYGFSFIAKFLNQINENEDAIKDENFNILLEKISSLDNVDIRTAREVIFKYSELIG